MWTADGLNEFEELACILWPEIGTMCSAILVCKLMRTLIICGPSGFWIIHVYLGWAGFVAESWEETHSLITDYTLWEKVNLKQPVEANKVAAVEAECRRANMPLTEEGTANVDELMTLIRNARRLGL
jgi:hypothetical protein